MAGIFRTGMKTGTIIPLIPPRIKFRPISECSSHSNQFRPILAEIHISADTRFWLKKKKSYLLLLLLLGFGPFFFLFSFFFLLVIFFFFWWVSVLPISLLFFICVLYSLNLLPLYSPRLPPLCVVFFFFFVIIIACSLPSDPSMPCIDLLLFNS